MGPKFAMNDQVTSSDETTTEESDQNTDKDGWYVDNENFFWLFCLTWDYIRILELETALLSDCDINVIRKMSNQQSIPNNLRYEFWQVIIIMINT